jgi:hypothetical protein
MIQSLTCRVLAVCSNDAPKLLAALRDMKDGLDLVKGKVEALTRKVLISLPLLASPPLSHGRNWRKLSFPRFAVISGGVWIGQGEPAADNKWNRVP